MTHVLRLLDRPDAPAYRELRLRGLAESATAFCSGPGDEHDRSLAEWADRVTPRGDPPSQFVLGALRDGALVGIITFVRDLREKARHKAMLYGMYVAPEARREGVGSAILRDVLQRARQLDGLEQLHLWVLHAPGVPNGAAALYEAHGFLAQGPRVPDDIRVGGVSLDAEYRVRRI